jgi:hypothetical protein
MAFDVRCPECKVRLRLDEAPEPGVEIECPRCDASFMPPSPGGTKGSEEKAKDKPKSEKPKKKEKAKTAGKKRNVKKKRTNPVVLLVAIGFGFLFLFGVGMAMIWVLNRPGKVMDMMGYVSGECNYARGLNFSHWNKYPGYASEVSKIFTSEMKAGSDECAKAAGADPEVFIDYLLIGKARYNGSTTTVYVFRTNRSFGVDKMSTLPGARPNGTNTYSLGANAPGILAGSSVYVPNNRTIVVVSRGAKSSQLLTDAQAGKANSFAKYFNDTIKTTARGASWLIVRNEGMLKNYIAETGSKGSDLPGVTDRTKVATTMGVWCTPGGSGVRVGLSLECSSRKDASDFVTAMKGGPLGKGDESEPTNVLKTSGVSGFSDKKAFGEFMQYATFTSMGCCAYVYSTVSGDANIRTWLNAFNNPTAATDEGGAGGGFGGLPGGGGGPGAPGLPGGVAMPGMGGPGR